MLPNSALAGVTMKRTPVSTAGRVFWGVLFVGGLLSLAVGAVFLFSGVEMMGWEK